MVTVLGFGWGALFLLAPESVGRALLGDTWAGTSASCWPMILGQLGGNLAHGASAALIGMDRAKVSLSLQAVFAPLTLVGGVGGVLLAGAEGAAWGFADPVLDPAAVLVDPAAPAGPPARSGAVRVGWAPARRAGVRARAARRTVIRRTVIRRTVMLCGGTRPGAG